MGFEIYTIIYSFFFLIPIFQVIKLNNGFIAKGRLNKAYIKGNKRYPNNNIEKISY